MPARGMRSGAAGRSEVDTNGSARRLDISPDRFRETKIALLLAICESRMTLVVPWTLGDRVSECVAAAAAGECGQVPRISGHC